MYQPPRGLVNKLFEKSKKFYTASAKEDNFSKVTCFVQSTLLQNGGPEGCSERSSSRF